MKITILDDWYDTLRGLPCFEKLAGHEDRYRVRQGVHRIVYSVSDEVLTVWVVKVGHRSQVYRR